MTHFNKLLTSTELFIFENIYEGRIDIKCRDGSYRSTYLNGCFSFVIMYLLLLSKFKVEIPMEVYCKILFRRGVSGRISSAVNSTGFEISSVHCEQIFTKSWCFVCFVSIFVLYSVLFICCYYCCRRNLLTQILILK